MRGFCLLSLLALSLSTSPLLGAADKGPLIPSVGRVVLRLSYRGKADAPPGKPTSIGLLVYESEHRAAGLVSTDWDGNLYLLDPLTSESTVLKRFDKQGRFLEEWSPIDDNYIGGLAVTRDGYIWMGPGGYEEGRAGLPLLAYRSGQKEPVLDWRDRLPKAINDRVRAGLNAQGKRWQAGWVVSRLESGTNRVCARLLGEAIQPPDGPFGGVFWVVLQSDGKEVLQTNVSLDSYGEDTPHLMPDDRFWASRSDFDVNRSTWSRFWLWQKGEPKGPPLIDRTSAKEPWPDTIRIAGADVPEVTVDTKGHIYLFWRRAAPKGRMQRFLIRGNIRATHYHSERALVVLDRQRRLLAYLPWMPETPESYGGGIQPLPDGSGFYRIQFLEKEAQVFFHPLPREGEVPRVAPAKTKRAR